MGNTCWVVVRDISNDLDLKIEVVPVAVFSTEEKARDQQLAHSGSEVIELPFDQDFDLAMPEGLTRYEVSMLQDNDYPARVAFQVKEAEPPITWLDLLNAKAGTLFYRGVFSVSGDKALLYGLSGAKEVIQRRGFVFAANEDEACSQAVKRYG